MLKHLCKKGNYHWMIALGKDYAIIAFVIYLSLGISYWFYPLSLFLIGTTQRALANILHESVHKMLAETQAINWFAGTFLSGYLLFHLHQCYVVSHIKSHHVRLGLPEKDPDYAFHLKCGLYDVNQSEREFFLKNVLMALSGFRTLQCIKYIVNDRVKTRVSAVYGNNWYLHLLHRIAEFPENIFLALDDVASKRRSTTAASY
ncbi:MULTISPECIES: fatty acid desaturase [unclassified Pseudomonas]|uniref:fatty acid desaturase n=1 Tax=unclassified Pseudomonas TaxID=196821 RepID=UPI001D142992|nr:MULTISPECIES: fatty acid desaturase [unclassified Pseudomonas]